MDPAQYLKGYSTLKKTFGHYIIYSGFYEHPEQFLIS